MQDMLASYLIKHKQSCDCRVFQVVPARHHAYYASAVNRQIKFTQAAGIEPEQPGNIANVLSIERAVYKHFLKVIQFRSRQRMHSLKLDSGMFQRKQDLY